MKLVSFSVKNYRSITSAHKIPVSESTILIGKNNDGKSNILNALAVSMNIIRFKSIASRFRYDAKFRLKRNDYYDYQRDFPILLRNRKGKKETIFILEFELTPEEILEFKNEIKSNLNGLLPISIRIDENNEPVVKVIKQGRGGPTLSKKSSAIAKFIGNKIKFTYIPAVRTAGAAIEVVNDMLEDLLFSLETNPEYINALEKIEEIQQPLLDMLSDKITKQLIEFIPQIKSATVSISKDATRRALRKQCEIAIDDGTPTLLELKGDGVKSLAALSLLKGTSEKGVASILALEEPESHLHPSAIHRLRGVINELSHDHQVVVTTHCPLFVYRNAPQKNILVTNTTARPARSIKEIRQLLGVKVSDNLINASLVLIVEGENDSIVLNSLLSGHSMLLKRALQDNTMIIEYMRGAGNLTYMVSLYQSSLCDIHIYLDNDDAGRDAFEKVIEEGFVNDSDGHFVVCNGQHDSEFEDMIDMSVYSSYIRDEFGVNINVRQFRTAHKWSDRAKRTFKSQGKPWNKRVETKLKMGLANLVAQNPVDALYKSKKSSFDSLVESLEKKLA